MTDRKSDRGRSRRERARLRRRRRRFLKISAGLVVGTSLAGYGFLRHLENEKRRIYPAISDDIRYSGFFLGCGVSCSSSSKWHYSTAYAQRFQAERSGMVTAVRWWNVAADQTSIMRGDGGILQIEMRRDDGQGSPSDTVLAYSKEIPRPAEAGEFPLVPLQPSVRLQKGLYYHIVYRQLASRQGSVSIGECRSFARPSDAQPYFEGALASFRLTGDDTWQRRPGVYPVFEVHYDDGIVKGQGYFLKGRQEPQKIGGTDAVRQAFRAAGGDFDVAAIHVRLYRASKSGKNLSLRLETGDGTLIEVLSVLETEVAFDPDFDTPASQRAGRLTTWVRKSLAQPHRLNEGDVCRVVLSAPGAASYQIHAMKHGAGKEAGFEEDKLHDVGMPHAEYSTNDERDWRPVGETGTTGHFDYPILLEFV